MITKEHILEKIRIAEERRERCKCQSVAWYFYEGQIAALTSIYVEID